MVLDVILDSNTHWSQWKSFNWQNGICIKVSKKKGEAKKKEEERNSDNGQNKKIKTPTPVLVSKQAAMLAYSNQKRAQKRGKELLLGAKTETLQWLGMMVPLLQCSSSQEVRWCFIPLNIVPSCCHPYAPCLIFFSKFHINCPKVLYIWKCVFMCCFQLHMFYLMDDFTAVLVSTPLFYFICLFFWLKAVTNCCS